VAVSGVFARSQHEFPHQVIETRSQILENIPDYETDGGRGPHTLVEDEKRGIRIAIWIAQNLAWISAEVPVHFGGKFPEVMCGAIEFVSNIFE
jgi:hypothetical protein